MDNIERKQIKTALLQCAEENKNNRTFTGNIIISSVCRAGVERITELEEEVKKIGADLEFEKSLNSDIKKRLVEVKCECNPDKKEKCVMFPEYCEGDKKSVIDLYALVNDGLNEKLLSQKDNEIAELKKKIEELSK